jgi:hypothetical protein
MELEQESHCTDLGFGTWACLNKALNNGVFGGHLQGALTVLDNNLLDVLDPHVLPDSIYPSAFIIYTWTTQTANLLLPL